MTDLNRRARREAREALVIEHMQSENVQEWDRTMATFSHARYELPDGTVIDGTDNVMKYWIEGRTLVPDQRNELIELTHLDDGQVLIEFWLRGTPTGGRRALRGPAMGGLRLRRQRSDHRRAGIRRPADSRSDRRRDDVIQKPLATT